VVRVILVAVVGTAAALALFPAFLAFRADLNSIIVAEPFDYVLLAFAAALVLAGAQVAAWRTAPYAATLATVGSAALLFAVLALFSIGLAVLPLGVVLVVLLYRALRRRPSTAARRAAIGGSLVGYGAVLLYIALIVPPLVECLPNGGGTSSGRWGGARPQVVTGRISAGPGGSMSGTIQSTTYRGYFRCEGGKIVEYQIEAR